MDPNANLRAQAELLATEGYTDKAYLSELRRDLARWLARGGFEPGWKAFPDASKAFRAWQRKARKFQDLMR